MLNSIFIRLSLPINPAFIKNKYLIFIKLYLKKFLFFLRSILTFDTEIQRGDEMEYCE